LRQKRQQLFTFPPPEEADENGLLAYGGDLSPERLISAYEAGVFPWFEDGQPILWWNPPMRMVLYPSEFKLSKTMRQKLKKEHFEFKIDTNFEQVIQQCAKVPRKDQAGTWITDEMMDAYTTLHRIGFAHSFETYLNNELVGGLYGISLGRAFFGESMFSIVSDSSKAAFYSLTQFAQKHHFTFIDCQLRTSHLTSLGAREIDRSQYLEELNLAIDHPDLQQNWSAL
jgi:leucyl/phenylalanyl-tRNA---protein transferase